MNFGNKSLLNWSETSKEYTFWNAGFKYDIGFG